MDIGEAARNITRFIEDYVENIGSSGVVIGLSGGLDSALTAFLCVDVLGGNRVDVVFLPCGSSDSSSLTDARKIAGLLGLELEILDISDAIDAIEQNRRGLDRLRYGNIAARLRMIYLYDISAERGKLVAGTGNRTERLLGYTTLWGDMACAFTPLGGLFKTQERSLSRRLGLPEWIIGKAPTADLWSGQTDEGELGIDYETADRILYALFDLHKTAGELEKQGFDAGDIELILRLFGQNEFKRRMPAFPELPGLPLR